MTDWRGRTTDSLGAKEIFLEGGKEHVEKGIEFVQRKVGLVAKKLICHLMIDDAFCGRHNYARKYMLKGKSNGA